MSGKRTIKPRRSQRRRECLRNDIRRAYSCRKTPGKRSRILSLKRLEYVLPSSQMSDTEQDAEPISKEGMPKVAMKIWLSLRESSVDASFHASSHAHLYLASRQAMLKSNMLRLLLNSYLVLSCFVFHDPPCNSPATSRLAHAPFSTLLPRHNAPSTTLNSLLKHQPSSKNKHKQNSS